MPGTPFVPETPKMTKTHGMPALPVLRTAPALRPLPAARFPARPASGTISHGLIFQTRIIHGCCDSWTVCHGFAEAVQAVSHDSRHGFCEAVAHADD